MNSTSRFLFKQTKLQSAPLQFFSGGRIRQKEVNRMLKYDCYMNCLVLMSLVSYLFTLHAIPNPVIGIDWFHCINHWRWKLNMKLSWAVNVNWPTWHTHTHTPTLWTDFECFNQYLINYNTPLLKVYLYYIELKHRLHTSAVMQTPPSQYDVISREQV